MIGRSLQLISKEYKQKLKGKKHYNWKIKVLEEIKLLKLWNWNSCFKLVLISSNLSSNKRNRKSVCSSYQVTWRASMKTIRTKGCKIDRLQSEILEEWCHTSLKKIWSEKMSLRCQRTLLLRTKITTSKGSTTIFSICKVSGTRFLTAMISRLIKLMDSSTLMKMSNKSKDRYLVISWSRQG